MTTLLIASGGGHLKQLHRLLPRLGVEDERLWVTFDTGLSRSLLAGQDVLFAPYAHPHDIVGTARNALFARKVLARNPVTRAISTGANLAVAFLPLARFHGARAQFIETATRSEGPSVTGRVLEKIPGIELYCQHRRTAHGRWHYGGSVFEGFNPVHYSTEVEVRKVVVTLGSNESFGFPRLVEHLRRIVPDGVDVVWQTGITQTDIAGARASIPAEELDAAMGEADVVVAHAGTGAALSALEAGKFPILVPRRKSHGEHVDDHQELTALFLAGRGLAMTAEADELTWDDLRAAAGWRIEESTSVAPFHFRS